MIDRQYFTKIVATLGPASSSKTVISSLIKSGVDVFRLNFSHGELETHQKNVLVVRELAKKAGKKIGIIADMQGPKLRIGAFAKGPITLEKGDIFRFDMKDKLGDKTRVTLPHPEIFAAMCQDMVLLLNDGKIKVKVVKFGKDFADTKVIVGGELSDHKGVNVPGVTLPISALTDKDKRNLKAALKMGVDWVALSFVQRPEDVIMAKKLIGDKAWIISKIEKPSALDHLDKIIDLSDGIMVARGDLGVEMPVETIPVLQKRIVYSCRKAGKPVVIATQMLESMMSSPTPTRAETSDVANAVFDGSDAVMLSGETAVGKYPVEAVKIMRNVLASVESIPVYSEILTDYFHRTADLSTVDAITASAEFVSTHMQGITALVTYTESGISSLHSAKARPCLPIISITPSECVARRLALVWGVVPYKTTTPLKSFDDVRATSVRIAKALKLAKKGDNLIITAGFPFSCQGGTNTLHIITV